MKSKEQIIKKLNKVKDEIKKEEKLASCSSMGNAMAAVAIVYGLNGERRMLEWILK